MTADLQAVHSQLCEPNDKWFVPAATRCREVDRIEEILRDPAVGVVEIGHACDLLSRLFSLSRRGKDDQNQPQDLKEDTSWSPTTELHDGHVAAAKQARALLLKNHFLEAAKRGLLSGHDAMRQAVAKALCTMTFDVVATGLDLLPAPQMVGREMDFADDENVLLVHEQPTYASLVDLLLTVLPGLVKDVESASCEVRTTLMTIRYALMALANLLSCEPRTLSADEGAMLLSARKLLDDQSPAYGLNANCNWDFILRYGFWQQEGDSALLHPAIVPAAEMARVSQRSTDANALYITYSDLREAIKDQPREKYMPLLAEKVYLTHDKTRGVEHDEFGVPMVGTRRAAISKILQDEDVFSTFSNALSAGGSAARMALTFASVASFKNNGPEDAEHFARFAGRAIDLVSVTSSSVLRKGAFQFLGHAFFYLDNADFATDLLDEETASSLTKSLENFLRQLSRDQRVLSADVDAALFATANLAHGSALLRSKFCASVPLMEMLPNLAGVSPLAGIQVLRYVWDTNFVLDEKNVETADLQNSLKNVLAATGGWGVCWGLLLHTVFSAVRKYTAGRVVREALALEPVRQLSIVFHFASESTNVPVHLLFAFQLRQLTGDEQEMLTGTNRSAMASGCEGVLPNPMDSKSDVRQQVSLGGVWSSLDPKLSLDDMVRKSDHIIHLYERVVSAQFLVLGGHLPNVKVEASLVSQTPWLDVRPSLLNIRGLTEEEKRHLANLDGLVEIGFAGVNTPPSSHAMFDKHLWVKLSQENAVALLRARAEDKPAPFWNAYLQQLSGGIGGVVQHCCEKADDFSIKSMVLNDTPLSFTRTAGMVFVGLPKDKTANKIDYEADSGKIYKILLQAQAFIFVHPGF